jgi:hypothetical protein
MRNRIVPLLIIAVAGALPSHAFASLVFKQLSPTPTDYTLGTDFFVATGSGFGDVTATAEAVDWDLGLGNTSTSGCELTDFSGFTVGNIALLQRGACLFSIKIDNAISAGAVGALIFNQGNAGDRLDAFEADLTPYTNGARAAIPVLATSYDVGVALDEAIIRIGVVPLPATCSLLGIGLLLLGFLRATRPT